MCGHVVFYDCGVCTLACVRVRTCVFVYTRMCVRCMRYLRVCLCVSCACIDVRAFVLVSVFAVAVALAIVSKCAFLFIFVFVFVFVCDMCCIIYVCCMICM